MLYNKQKLAKKPMTRPGHKGGKALSKVAKEELELRSLLEKMYAI